MSEIPGGELTILVQKDHGPVKDDRGRKRPDWQDFITREGCALEPLTGSEVEIAGKLSVDADFRAYMPYDEEVTQITEAKFRLVILGVKYNVQWVDNVGFINVHFEILVLKIK